MYPNFLARLACCLGLLLLNACTPDLPHQSQATSPPRWPRVIATSQGPVQLDYPPRRIVSTSVTLTGTLLAINAPLIASGASRPNSSVTDAQGFFRQWSTIAQSRGLIPLYQGEANAEAILAADPDLIVIAGTGGDSALKLREQLSSIAPVLVINYDDKTWQELALLLGQATGHENDARELITTFEAQLAASRARIHLPPQPTTALTYYEDGLGANVWTADSAQGELLNALGFTLAPVPASAQGLHSMGRRRDIIEIGGERFAEGLQGQSLLLFSGDEKTAAALMQNRFLAQIPAVQKRQVYSAGLNTFRLDYYSSSALLEKLARDFGARK